MLKLKLKNDAVLAPTIQCAQNDALLQRNHAFVSGIDFSIQRSFREAQQFVLAHGIERMKPCLLIGQANIGKTSLIAFICDELGLPMLHVKCCQLSECQASDLFYGDGSWTEEMGLRQRCGVPVDGNSPGSQRGVLREAAKYGQVVFLDDLNRLGRGACSLKPFLEGNSFCAGNGEVITPKAAHPNFRILAAMRPAGIHNPELPPLVPEVSELFSKFCWLV